MCLGIAIIGVNGNAGLTGVAYSPYNNKALLQRESFERDLNDNISESKESASLHLALHCVDLVMEVRRKWMKQFTLMKPFH